MNTQLNGPMFWNRYFREGAFIIVLLVVSFQPAFSAMKTDDAPTSKSGSKFVASGGSGPDVIGLRIGTSPDEARAIFKSRGFGLSQTPPDMYGEKLKTLAFALPGQNPQPIPNTSYLAGIHSFFSERPTSDMKNWSSHGLEVVFGPVPGQEGIVSLERKETIPDSKRPTVDAFEKTLVEKYGTPTEKPSPNLYRWRYDSNGRLLKPSPSTSFVKCLEYSSPAPTYYETLKIDQYLENLRSIEEFENPAGCGAIFVQVVLGVNGVGPGALVNSYSTSMLGYDAYKRALDAAKAIIEKAQADASGSAIKKGQQQKPDL